MRSALYDVLIRKRELYYLRSGLLLLLSLLMSLNGNTSTWLNVRLRLVCIRVHVRMIN